MWRLRTSGDRFLTIASLPATLGSGADNDLRLRHASVLPSHARFAQGPDGRLAVLALGEAVVGIGGRRVQRGTVGDGEELVLGRLRFTVERAERAARPAAGRRAGRGVAAGADELLKTRERTLRFARQPARRGLLRVDFAQLSGWWKAAVVAALLLVGGGLLVGAALLAGLLG